MLLRLDPSDEAPLYRQIASAIRRGLGTGEINEGDRLPAARDLASALEVNMHTVLRAYSELKDEGVVEMRPGRGSVIRTGGVSSAALAQLTAELAREARRHGLGIDELVELLKKEMT
jgi:GntR family transcriptional regulator